LAWKKAAAKDIEKAKTNLVIYAVVGNKVVGVLKEGTGADSVMTEADLATQVQLNRIRAMAVERILSTTEDVVDLEIEVPVEKVFVGRPKFNLTAQEGGRATVNKITLNERGKKTVVNVGYVQNGKVTLVNSSSLRQPTSYTFVSKFLADDFKNKTQRIPIAVINVNGTRVAYPIHISENISTISAGERASEIFLDENLSITGKLAAYYDMLAEYSIDVVDMNVELSLSNMTASNMDKIITTLDEVYSPTSNINLWDKADMKDILPNLEFDIDVNNNPFHSPKVRMDFLAAGLGVPPAAASGPADIAAPLASEANDELDKPCE